MFTYAQLARLLEALGVSKRLQLYEYAKSQLGKEKKGIPDTASQNVNCVEALNQIGIECFGKPFCQGASTITLSLTLKGSIRFAAVNLRDVLPGDIIVSPTSGKRIGHTGVVGKDGKVYSNNSNTGLWTDHWEITKWYLKYSVEYGLPVEFYRVIL